MKSRHRVVFGSRKSKLAVWQTEAVVSRLAEDYPEIEFVVRQFTTSGDENLSQPLPEIGGKGLFTAELDRAIADSEIDIAVHSLKDLPTEEADGIRIIPVLEREDARDVLITRAGCSLDELPVSSIVGTSSLRRQAQLLALRPDLVCRPIRGNVPTRIEKVRQGEFDAALLAAAGVLRLGLQNEVADWINLTHILPAPGQAMIAATCRCDDEFVVALLEQIQDHHDVQCVTAERELLRQMGGGCSAPIAAHAAFDVNERIRLTARIGLPNGTSSLQSTFVDDDPFRAAEELSTNLKRNGAGVYLSRGPSKNLAGKRVVVTRAAEQCAEFSSLLREMGAIPLEMPAIMFRSVEPDDLTSVVQQLSSFDWILFSSSNAVRFFFEKLKNFATADTDTALPTGVKCACVGSRTAASLERLGIIPDFVPEKFSGRSLAKELVEHIKKESGGALPDRLRLAYPCASQTAQGLLSELTKSGHVVAPITVYETIESSFTDEAVEQLQQGVDVITFASPSAVASFCRQLQEKNLLESVTAGSAVACIGSTTRRAAEARGIRVQITAGQPAIPALVEALDNQLTQI